MAYSKTINGSPGIFFVTSRIYLLLQFPANLFLGTTQRFLHWPPRDFVGYAALGEGLFFSILLQGLIGFAVSFRPTLAKSAQALIAVEIFLVTASFTVINLFPDTFYYRELILPSRTTAGRADSFAEWLKGLPPGSEQKALEKYDALDLPQRNFVLRDCLNGCDGAKKSLVAIEYFRVAKDSSQKAVGMLSLEAYKDPVLTPVLESLLKDTDPLIRSRAACQLAKTTGKLYEYDGDYRPWPGTECEALQKQLRAALPAERIRSDELKMQAAVQAAYEATLSTGPEQAVVPLTKAQIDSDLFPSYGLSKYRQTEWLRIVSDLPEPRRSQDSEMILKRVHVWPVVVDNIWSSGDCLPQEVRNIQDYLKVLGEAAPRCPGKLLSVT